MLKLDHVRMFAMIFSLSIIVGVNHLFHLYLLDKDIKKQGFLPYLGLNNIYNIIYRTSRLRIMELVCLRSFRKRFLMRLRGRTLSGLQRCWERVLVWRLRSELST